MGGAPWFCDSRLSAHAALFHPQLCEGVLLETGGLVPLSITHIFVIYAAQWDRAAAGQPLVQPPATSALEACPCRNIGVETDPAMVLYYSSTWAASTFNGSAEASAQLTTARSLSDLSLSRNYLKRIPI